MLLHWKTLSFSHMQSLYDFDIAVITQPVVSSEIEQLIIVTMEAASNNTASQGWKGNSAIRRGQSCRAANDGLLVLEDAGLLFSKFRHWTRKCIVAISFLNFLRTWYPFRENNSQRYPLAADIIVRSNKLSQPIHLRLGRKRGDFCFASPSCSNEGDADI